MGYLDTSGLEHLWGKIIGRTPVMRRLTQDEYDSLTDEEKQSGTLFVITDKPPFALDATDKRYLKLSGETIQAVNGPVTFKKKVTMGDQQLHFNYDPLSFIIPQSDETSITALDGGYRFYINGQKAALTIGDPTHDDHAANKKYVDNLAATKQDILTGEPGRIIGFGSNGVPEAQGLDVINNYSLASTRTDDKIKFHLDGSYLIEPLRYGAFKFSGLRLPGERNVYGIHGHVLYGTLQVSANIRHSSNINRNALLDLVLEEPTMELGNRTYRIFIVESGSINLRCLTLQAPSDSNATPTGVYCDVTSPVGNVIHPGIIIRIIPAQIIKMTNTLWIELQIPVTLVAEI